MSSQRMWQKLLLRKFVLRPLALSKASRIALAAVISWVVGLTNIITSSLHQAIP
uniref:Uncharacterized protein n=1 Tax=Triticum urartu TaxID=4572 RepID=A0A8R7QAQ2_TRIUA